VMTEWCGAQRNQCVCMCVKLCTVSPLRDDGACLQSLDNLERGCTLGLHTLGQGCMLSSLVPEEADR
jgi:hypothetical protein